MASMAFILSTLETCPASTIAFWEEYTLGDSSGKISCSLALRASRSWVTSSLSVRKQSFS